MDSVRCPMCGKSNPPNTVICQFCQARLEPLIAPSAGEDNEINEPEAPLEESGSLPSWLEGLRNQNGPDEPEAPFDDSSALPDWLDGMRDADEGDQEEETGTGESQEEDLAGDWSVEEDDRLSSAFSTSIEGDAEQDQDWLSRLEADVPGQVSGELAETFSDPSSAPSAFLSMDELLGEEGSSDWLAEFQTSSLGLDVPAGETEEAAQEAVETPQEELPSWLGMIRAQQEKESEPEQAPVFPDEAEVEEPGSPETDLTGQTGESDWLSDIGIDEGGEDFTVDSKDLPDWMAEVDPSQQEEQKGSSAVIPGWLNESELKQEEPASLDSAGLPDWLEEGAEEELSPAQTPRQDLPDWLTGIDQSGLPEPVESEAEEAPVPSEESGVPAWLTRLDATGTYPPSGADSPAVILEEQQPEELEPVSTQGSSVEGDLSAVPDWLSQISSQEEHVEASAPLEEDELEPDLAEAQLPSWLQAMRPVESAAPSAPGDQEQAGKVEKAGPLAGLAGVLAAEPEFIHIRKPQSSLVKLQISDNQQSHITLLENLLAEEGQAKPVAARSAISSQYFLRLLIAIVVLVSVVLPLWLNRQILPMPDPGGVSNEVYEFGRTVGGLPSGASVLVAFDYEPGFSGEIDAAAAAVLAELAGRGIHLALVSTNPTGPLLAERFTLTRLPEPGASFTNLGYVPGGAGGLLAFAGSPRAVIPFDLHGARVWEMAPLSGVNSVSDFGAVIVLTENPDTARTWIEQVQPNLGSANKPLLMVLSAQAEPMVRPYYETSPRQVSGMISGLAGGAAFESISGKPGLSRQYWDAFGIGLVIAVGLILVGGLVSLVLVLLTQPGKKDVEGAL